MPLSVYSRTISRAADVLGSEKALAVRFNVSAPTIRRWARGDRVPPMRYFLMAVDILDEQQAGLTLTVPGRRNKKNDSSSHPEGV